MSKSKRTPHARAAELRALLECTSATERTSDAARRLVAERDGLRRRVRELESALEVAWDAAGETLEEATRRVS